MLGVSKKYLATGDLRSRGLCKCHGGKKTSRTIVKTSQVANTGSYSSQRGAGQDSDSLNIGYLTRARFQPGANNHFLHLGKSSLDTLASHNLLILHRCTHAIRIHLSIKRLHNLQESTMEALLLCDRAVFVGQEKCFQVDDLLSQLGNLGGESVVLGAEHLNLGLKVCKPLLLPLATFQSRHSAIQSN
jgi:hypothetical protein